MGRAGGGGNVGRIADYARRIGQSFFELGMRFTFNPQLVRLSRRSYIEQLRLAVENARELHFDIIELSLTGPEYGLGLGTLFGGDIFDVMKASPTSFHLHLFPDVATSGEPTLSDVQPYPRSIALRRTVQVVEFFERASPMEMYVVHAGSREAHYDRHLAALKESFRTLGDLFPGLPIAVQNGSGVGVLAELDLVLAFLDEAQNMRFSLHTGFAFQSVGMRHHTFVDRLGYLRRFGDRLAEIRWHNTAPGMRPSVPLHVETEHGLDLEEVVALVGRNPGTVHLIETVGNNAPALARERRVLHSVLAG